MESDELRDGLAACGVKITGYEVRVILNKLDTDKDGRLSFEEFKRVSMLNIASS